MLNIVAKCLLVSTSLSPMLGAVAVNKFERGEPWTIWIWWLVGAFILVFLCWFLLSYTAKNAQKCFLFINEFERKDQETLTFLLIYLLPFLRSEHSTFANEWLTSLYVIVIIIVAIMYAGAYHFNPVMRFLFGYRFYGVKDRFGVPNLLISKTDLRQPKKEVQTVRLARNVHIYIGGEDA